MDSHIIRICFTVFGAVEEGLAFKAVPVGMSQERQLIIREMILAAHPVGAEAMSAELRSSMAMVLLWVAWMQNVFPVPARPSTNKFSHGGVSSSISPRSFPCWRRLKTVSVALGKNIGSRLSVGVAKAWWDGCYDVERTEVVPGTARVNSSLTRQEVLQMIKTLEEESLASSQNNFIVERSKGSTTRFDS